MEENRDELIPGGFIPGKNMLRACLPALKDPSYTVKMDDESFIRQLLMDDAPRGFALLFRRYYGSLCSHAIRFVYSREVAEDLVSEIFAVFWETGAYRTVAISYRAYLYTAVRNRAFNYLKREFSKKGDPPGEQANAIAETMDPQSQLLLNELFRKIEQTIHAFPPQCRRVFMLSRFEGKKNREIAEEMNIKLKTVESHMMKALSALKESLSDYLH